MLSAHVYVGLFLLTVAVGAAWAPAATPTILPLGDSITYGYGPTATYADNNDPGGYRSPLYTDLTNQGKTFQYVGSSTLNPGSLPAGEQAQEGHSGYTIAQINGNLSADEPVNTNSPGTDNDGGYWLTGGGGTGRSAIFPSIILLHIGTNDSSQGARQTQMEADLTTLLNNLKGALPNSQVFVASLIPRTDNSYDSGAGSPLRRLKKLTTPTFHRS